jgi:hypothetical protein
MKRLSSIIQSTGLLLALIFIFSAQAYGEMSSASYNVPLDSITSGGGSCLSGGYKNAATIGATFGAATATSPSYANSGTFWGQLGYVVPSPQTVSFTGKVQDCSTGACAYLPDVTATTIGLTPEITTTSDASGQFTLAGIPKATPFTIKMSKTGFIDTYSIQMSLYADYTLSNLRSYILYKSATLAAWGIDPGKGVIRGRVVLNSNQNTGFIAGATVSANDAVNGTPYEVVYENTSGSFAGSSTYNNGLFYVRNVPSGRTVNVTAELNGYTFEPIQLLVAADSVSVGRVVGVNTRSISGTVSYSGTKTGRIYLGFFSDSNIWMGTSIAAPGSFTINGVPDDGEYTLLAYMDTTATQVHRPSDPVGNVVFQKTPGSAATGIALTLKDPQNVPSLPPTELQIFHGPDHLAVLFYGEEGDKHNIYWSTNPDVIGTAAAMGGKHLNFVQDSLGKYDGTQIFLIGNLSAGTSYYVAVTNTNGGIESDPKIVGPITVGSAPAGGTTVSGTVDLNGTPGNVPALLFLLPRFNNAKPMSILVPNASTTIPFTFNNVLPGKYLLFTILDNNANGILDDADVRAFPKNVDVGTLPVSDVGVSLSPANAMVEIATVASKYYSSIGYGLTFDYDQLRKRPVNISLISGKQSLPYPMDLCVSGCEDWMHAGDGTEPQPGDQYTYLFTYADGSTEQLVGEVTKVLNSFPEITSPQGDITSRIPSITWDPPADISDLWNYDIDINDADGNRIWFREDIPATATSTVYSGPPLQDGEYSVSLHYHGVNANLASVSAGFSVAVSDNELPVINIFSLSGPSTSLIVPITWDVTDNVAVTGIYVSESPAEPSPTAAGWGPAPTTHTFIAPGSRTLYAWAQDAAGNYSLRATATVVITLPAVTEPVSPGNNIPVVTTPPGSTAQLININFMSVVTPGTITVTPLPDPLAPSNFRIVGGTTYDIETTAGYQGSVTICIGYDPTKITMSENQLRLLHHTGATWEDITTLVDTANNKVCGISSTLSPFAIGERAATQAPVISITGTPAALTKQASGLFYFNSDYLTGFECRIDSGNYGSCNSPYQFTNLDDGGRTFSVRSPGGVPVSYSWTIDTSAPVITVNSPAEGFTSSSAKVTLIGNVSDLSGVTTFSINGIDVKPAAGGAFTHELTLLSGSNTVTLAASDTLGQSLFVTREINYKPVTKPGDCDNISGVSIAEVQAAINMYLGLMQTQPCVDTDGIPGVSISEVQKVINGYLGL